MNECMAMMFIFLFAFTTQVMLPNILKFWLLLIFLVPSIICSLFILYYFLFKRVLRRALTNHVIIVVLIIGLICEVTNYPWMLYYYQYQGTWRRSLIFCEIWGFFDWGMYITHTILFAWGTIERHILIFHDRWLSTKRKRFLIHYLPMILLLLYCFIFYIIITFFPLCENAVYNGYECLAYCLYDDRILSTWQTIFHQVIPNLIIVLISIALLIRVLRQKYRVHQMIQWRKHRRMAIQLLSISFLYLIFSFPVTMVYIFRLFNPSFRVDRNFFDAANYFSYYMIILLPFVCILSFPELRKKLNRLIDFKRRRAVGPVPWTTKAIPNYFNRTY